jgi:hypothetical protein
MLRDHCIFCWRKKTGGFDPTYYVSNSINLRELLAGVCLSCPFWNMPCNMFCSKNILKKSYGLLEFESSPLLEGEPNTNSVKPCTRIHNLPCRTPCKLFIHKLFFGPLDLTSQCEVNLDGLRLFDQCGLLHCHGQGPSALCVKWPSVHNRGLEARRVRVALNPNPSKLKTGCDGCY